MTQLIDMTGRKFGRWTVLERAPRGKVSNAKWLCRCECGNERAVVSVVLRRGESVSCGCYRAEVSAQRELKHGHAVGRTTRTYNSWASMMHRCTNPNYYQWENYGGRGIKVCERWQQFENFLADMGERPSGTTLDRV